MLAQFKYHENCSQFDRNDQFSLFSNRGRNFNFQMSLSKLPGKTVYVLVDNCLPTAAQLCQRGESSPGLQATRAARLLN